MNSIRINRITRLKGTVKISGSKNAALPIVCASLLANGKVTLKNVPRISDIKKLIKIIKYLNCKVKWKGHCLRIDSEKIKYKPLKIKECMEIRGSYYLIPILLYIFGKCEIALPGGCKIGQRPIDAHIDAFKAIGWDIFEMDNILKVVEGNRKDEFHYEMLKQSVGASINTILASLSCKYAVIDGLILEPEGLALIEFLNIIGFKIFSLNHRCVYKGYDLPKKKIVYKIIPDRMEAITFILLGLLCGEIKVKKLNVDHIKFPLDLLLKSNFNIKIKKNKVYAYRSRGNAFDIKTDVYPLFPTDMQPLFGVLMASSRGSCVVEETIFENRMQIYKDLNFAGASVNLIDNKAYIIGGSALNSREHDCVDLRQSAALMLLILRYGGKANHIEILQRGYEGFFNKIKRLGAKFSIR